MNSYRWIVRCHGRGPGFECAAFHLHFLCWYNRAREELFLLILKRHRQSSRSPYFNSSAPGDWSSKFSSSLLPAHLYLWLVLTLSLLVHVFRSVSCGTM